MWVRDTWRELGVALLRQVDHSGWPVLTGWYVIFFFFQGAAEGATLPAWLMARYLSVCQSGQVHSPVQRLHGVAIDRAKEQGFTLSGYVIPFFFILFNRHYFPYISKQASLCSSTIVIVFICGLITSRWCIHKQDTVFFSQSEWALFVDFPGRSHLKTRTWVYSLWLLVIFFSLGRELSLSADEMSVTGLNSPMCAKHMLL